MALHEATEKFKLAWRENAARCETIRIEDNECSAAPFGGIGKES